jgi:hypothetical protein
MVVDSYDGDGVVDKNEACAAAGQRQKMVRASVFLEQADPLHRVGQALPARGEVVVIADEFA